MDYCPWFHLLVITSICVAKEERIQFVSPKHKDPHSSVLQLSIGSPKGLATMISLVLLLACPLGVFAASFMPLPNHAHNKYSEQSSQYLNWRARYANDYSTPNWDRDCAVTTGNDSWNWWMVDLGEDTIIKSVRITNREKDFYDYLSNFYIEVSTENPKTQYGFPGPVRNSSICLYQTLAVPRSREWVYACDKPVTGRFVRLAQHNPKLQHLYLCELEVYSYVETNYTVWPSSLNNIALNKPTSQSTLHSNSKSENAVDGILKTTYPHDRTCTATNSDPTPWWMVDLGRNFGMNTMTILGRGDCCQDRTRAFSIEVSVDDPTSYAGFPGRTSNSSLCMSQIEPINYGRPVVITCDRPVVGRYVRLVKEIPEDMTFCEFEVFELKRFTYIGGSQVMESRMDDNSVQERRYTTRCTRQFMKDIVAIRYNGFSKMFVHVDLDDGTCRYLEAFQDSKNVTSARWVVYGYG